MTLLDPNQAFLTGNIAGLLMANSRAMQVNDKIDVEVVDDNYTNRIFVYRPSGKFTITVEGPE